MIGAHKLGEFAARLEKAGEAGDIKTLESEMGVLLTEYKKLVKELEPLADNKDEGSYDERPLISEQDMKKAYADLEAFCQAFDYDGVGNVVKELEGYRFPESEAERFKAIKKAVDNFDYDQIPGILASQ